MNLDPIVYPVSYREQRLYILDQTSLPEKEVYIELNNVEQVFHAIRELKVRGAPAIGIAAAYGFAMGIQKAPNNSHEDLRESALKIKRLLESSRPTAVNLFWSLNRMMNKLISCIEDSLSLSEIFREIELEAVRIHQEDLDASRNMVKNFFAVFKDRDGATGVLTHCNTGALATGGIGTALACIRAGYERGLVGKVYVTETRPLNQGSRLTAWELEKYGIPYEVVVDGLSAHLVARGYVRAVIVGADRVASNGDVANKVGTFTHAVIAKTFGAGFYVVCPESTVDEEIKSGDEIEIEVRDGAEIAFCGKKRLAPDPSRCFNPAFDVTPSRYIDAIITDRRIIKPEVRNLGC
jgi:methylthioribose-1-phosphate isomerase